MVATRGQPSPAASSPPPTAPEKLSKAQQAALKKLQIVGTDALKGDPKAAQAAREQVQTYHYRGAVYAADANTPSSWIENQPKRYLKRGAEDSEGGTEEGNEDGENDENDTPVRRPAKRRRSMPQEGLNNKSGAAMTASASGKSRSGRVGRHSLPGKGNATVISDEGDDVNIVHTASSRVNDRVARPQHRNRRRESSTERRERYSRRDNTVPTLANTKIMDRENQRRKEEARRKNYQVEALQPKDMLSQLDLMRARHVRLARAQRDINEKLREWNLAKELLDKKRREAGLTRSTFDAPRVPSQTIKYTQTIDLTGSDSDGGNRGDVEEVNKQWEREQEQNRAHDKDQRDPEVPETSPAEEEPIDLGPAPLRSAYDAQPTEFDRRTLHNQYDEQPSQDTYTAAGASRPSSPLPTIATGANTCPLLQKRGFLASLAPTLNYPEISTTESQSSISTTDTTAFMCLPPDSALPTVSAGGHPLRWTIKRRASITPGSATERAEYAIDVARLEGESKAARARRIKRERAVVESWAKMNGADIVEEDGRV